MVYVANCGSNTVSVIDSSNDVLLGSPDVGDFPTGIAVNPITIWSM
jgi:YVTN family beta-propeller protein